MRRKWPPNLGAYWARSPIWAKALFAQGLLSFFMVGCSYSNKITGDIGADPVDTDFSSFLQGTHTNTVVTGNTLQFVPALASHTLPHDSLSTGWVDMSGNVLLAHLDSVGPTLPDRSAESNDLTVFGASATTGQVGGALSFTDSSSDYLIVSAMNNFPTTEITVEFWIKTSGPVTGRHVFSYAHAGEDDEFRIGFGSSDEWWVVVGNQERFLSVNGIADGNWHHVAISYRGADQKVRVYEDGLLVSEGAVVAGPASIVSGGTLTIAEDQDSPGGGFNPLQAFIGEIDELAIYSRILSGGEVGARYYAMKSQPAQGVYTSRVFNGGSTQTWKDVAWTPQAPYGKGALAGNLSETAYATNNVDFTSTALIVTMEDSLWNGTLGEVVDLSTNASHGTAANGAALSPEGKIAQGGLFDGQDDELVWQDGDLGNNFPGQSGFAGSDFSVSAWVWLDDQRIQFIFAKDQLAARSFSLSLSSASQLFAQVFNSGGNSANLASSAVLPLGTWVHVAMTYKYVADSTSVIRLYVNGQKDSNEQLAARGPVAPVITSFTIGSRKYAGQEDYFAGRIDEVIVWTKELSQAEVQTLYERGASRLRIQIKTCLEVTCTSGEFVGPDGSSSSYFSEANNSGVALPSFTLFGSPTSSRFQYRIFIDTHGLSQTPTLSSINITH